MKPVGVLGGMGPAATINLMRKVLAAQSSEESIEHVPLIVHENPQVPSRIEALIDGTGADPMPVLMSMAQDLERAGAQALAMPSHLAHQYAIAVSHATSLPFLNMIDITAKRLSQGGGQKVGMIISPAAHVTGVFVKAFEEHSLQPVWLQDEMSIKDAIKAARKDTPPQQISEILQSCANILSTAGADQILIANGILSPFAETVQSDLPCIDSVECLAREIADFSAK